VNWKNYLTFSRSERNGIVVFAILLVVIILAPKIHDIFFYEQKRIDPESFKKDILAFEDQLRKIENKTRISYTTKKTHDLNNNLPKSEKPQILLQPIEFNPNQLEEKLWLDMGMPENVVRTIKNYEDAGGSFRFKEDVNRIYGITDEMYAQLSPYIKLPSKDQFYKDSESIKADEVKETDEKPEKPLLVDINTADTLELMKIRGIGPFYSKSIVEYRNSLGGFVSIYQLMDIYGMNDERFESIKKHIIIKDSVIKQININEADFSEMIRHPYLNRNLVNNLIVMRQQHGKFHAIEDIKRSHIIDDETFAIIAPYLKLDK